MTTITVSQAANRSSTIALDALNASYMRQNYLLGLDFFSDRQTRVTDDWFEEKITQSIAKFEDITAIDVLQRVITDETHDYHTNDYLNYAFVQLFRIPAQSVQQVRAVYPTGQTIQIFPSEWVRLEVTHSQFHLVPTSGSLAQVLLGGGNGYLPFIFAGLAYLPQLWHVDYQSGFDPEKIPYSVADALMKYATIEALQALSDLIGPIGQQSSSLGIDGLSQSVSRVIPAFKARIDAYRRDLGLDDPNLRTGIIGQLRRTYMGINMVSG